MEIYIVINGSGKTGTTSLYKSFNSLNISVQHSHNLFEANELGPGFSKNKCTYEEINKLLLQKDKQIKFILIDSFRDPIERKISSFFQNIINNQNYKFIDIDHVLDTYKNQGIQPFIELFNKNINIENYQSCLQWEKAFNFNIFQYAFDKKEKYMYIENNNINFLLLRFDDINNWNTIIKNKLNIPKFKLVKNNVSENKWYHHIYKDFKTHYRVPINLFEKIFKEQEKLLNYFYTSVEIEEFKKKWIK
jgi:hypothetical protein